MPLTPDRLAEIRAALASVPAPPWQWIGDRRTRAMLTTTHSGWQYLLGAELPLDRHGNQAENLDGSPIWADLEFRHQADGAKYATLTPARELAVGRTEYDPDTIRDIDNPVARWMRDAPQYVAELLAEVERLRCTDPIECGHEAALGQAEAELARRDHADAEDLADQTMLRSLNVGPDGMVLDLAPPPGLVLSLVETAKQILGDAPNYTETPVTLTVSAAGEYERYAFVVQRVGKTTPHQAREQAEAERDRLRHALERAALSVEHDSASSACKKVPATHRRFTEHAEDCPACDVADALNPGQVQL